MKKENRRKGKGRMIFPSLESYFSNNSLPYAKSLRIFSFFVLFLLSLSIVSAMSWKKDGTETMTLDDYGNLTVIGTVNATSFVGDGSGLTGVGGTVTDVWVNESGDTMTGNLNINADLAVDTNVLYVNSTSNEVGIGTATPNARLEVNGGAVLFSGDTGSTPTSGAGERMMWIPAKSAFRAGYVSSTQWDDASIGSYSVALGYNPSATQLYSVGIGYSAAATNSYAVAIGRSANAGGGSSVALGYDASTSVGSYNTALGNSALAKSNFATAIGNIDVGTSSTNAQYSVGIGLSGSTSYITTPNVMAIMGGNVGIGTTSPSANLDVYDSGYGVVEIDGTQGGWLKLRDTDNLGWTCCTALGGTLSCESCG